jgi:serine/threonine protein kinase
MRQTCGIVAKNERSGITIWPNSDSTISGWLQSLWGQGDRAAQGMKMATTALRIEDQDVGIESFADELKPGARLLMGQYTIDSFLNAGGFGITYVARDSLDRRVVVKECFPSSFCRRSDTIVAASSRQRQEEFRSLVQVFRQEALTLSKFDHPNIVKVHEVFEDNETAYMAMDHIPGHDLLETIEGTAKRLSPAEIMAALDKLLDALSYVHGRGFLHRDISPDNIMLDTQTGQPVLIDFGAARKEVTRKSRALSGLRVVKDGYSPQEFYISGSAQAPNSDLYALAATFCHLVSGEAPKTSQERLSAIASREGDPQPPLVGRVKGYPKAFLAAIDQAMAIFPKDRLQSAADWQAMLRGGVSLKVVSAVPAPVVAASVVSKALSQRPVKVVSTPAIGRYTRTIPVVLAAGALVLMVAGTMVVTADHWRGSSDPTTSAGAGDAATASTMAVSQFRLPNGMSFDIEPTETGYRTIVSALPTTGDTDLELGDVLLGYAATGEALGSATALQEILAREAANGVATFGFAIQRKGGVAVASFTYTGNL